MITFQFRPLIVALCRAVPQLSSFCPLPCHKAHYTPYLLLPTQSDPTQRSFHVCVCVCVCVCACVCAHMPWHRCIGQEDFQESVLSFYHVVLGLNSGQQAWQQVLLPTEPFCWTSSTFFIISFLKKN